MMYHILLKHQLRRGTLIEKQEHPFDKFLFYHNNGCYHHSRIRYNTSLYLQRSELDAVLQWMTENYFDDADVSSTPQERAGKKYTHRLNCMRGIPSINLTKIFGDKFRVLGNYQLVGVGFFVNKKARSSATQPRSLGNIEIEFQDRTSFKRDSHGKYYYERFCINVHVKLNTLRKKTPLYLEAYFHKIKEQLFLHKDMLAKISTVNNDNAHKHGYHISPTSGNYAKKMIFFTESRPQSQGVHVKPHLILNDLSLYSY